MGKVFAVIDDELARFIAAQHMFFVATAPLAGGHVNVSPKGLDSLRVLGPSRVAYADLTGSGVETIAHLRENGRITLMFCAFAGPPKILRLYGVGRARVPHTPEFDELLPAFPPLAGVRAIIDVEVTRVADSCGFGVPLFEPSWGARCAHEDGAGEGRERARGLPTRQERSQHRRPARALSASALLRESGVLQPRR